MQNQQRLEQICENLKQAIDNDDTQAALALINQGSLLNQYCVRVNPAWTPVGYAAENNKLKCLDAICSMRGVDLSLGKRVQHHWDVFDSPMYLALTKGHAEAAKILATRGAPACTQEEIASLGEKYTNFQLMIQKEQENPEKIEEAVRSKGERGLIRYWIDSSQFEKLQQWLGESKTQLEARWEAREVPVVGWSQLAAALQGEASKIDLEAELEQIAREQEQLAEQMRNLQQKQETLENRKQQLQAHINELDKIAVLQAESESIAFLGQKEEASLANLAKKMENPYFIRELDADDVSTVFSLFNMDSLFPRYRQRLYKNLRAAANRAVTDLQKKLNLDFSEAVELVWKFKLLEHGEKGCARHLSKCSICSSKTPVTLLQEYGMKQEDIKLIEGKIARWKGYYFTADAASAALELNVEAELASKLATCWAKIQKVHKWEHPDD